MKVEKGEDRERGRKRHGLQTKRMMMRRRKSIRTIIVPIMLMVSNIAIVFAVSLSLLLSLLHLPPLLPSRLVPDKTTSRFEFFLPLLSLSLSLLFFLPSPVFFSF